MPLTRSSVAASLGQPDDNPVREFAFSEQDFQTLMQLAYEHAGIALSASKQNLIYSRLSRRLRVLRLQTFNEYCEYIEANPSEVENFINSISTNHTKFFREAHHFEHFRAQVAVPFAQEAARKPGGRLRVWSAGCSSGEEPYTIATVLKREIRDPGRSDVRILATDIDTDVLRRAARGEFAPSTLDDVPQPYLGYFEPLDDTSANAGFVVAEEVRSLIAFRRLNLMEPWPFNGIFDAIFCRNVMIYFDGPTKAALVGRFTQKLKPGGWLYIGHSESLIGAHPGLQLSGRTIYRRDK